MISADWYLVTVKLTQICAASATEIRFDSILDAAMALMESGTNAAREQLVKFAKDDRFARFLEAVIRLNSRKASISSDEIDSEICTTAQTLHFADWNALTDSRLDQRLRMTLKNMTPDHINSFSLTKLYSEMRSKAPSSGSPIRYYSSFDKI